MSQEGNNLNNIKITVSPMEEEQAESPRFGGVQAPPKKEANEAMMKVGKHGKSHHEYMKVLKGIPPNREHRKVSMKELAEHNTLESAWLSLNGVVYDVTVYIHYHPGGEILLTGCGKEAAPLFSSDRSMQTSTTLG